MHEAKQVEKLKVYWKAQAHAFVDDIKNIYTQCIIDLQTPCIMFGYSSCRHYANAKF